MVATTKDKILTEAEILAAPEEEYMNPAQLEFFRDRLSRMRQELLDNAASTGASLRENEIVADPADRATVEEEHALELRVRDRERKLLKKIDEALNRIAEVALRQFTLDACPQVLDFFLVDEKIAVAGHTELVAAEHLHA